LNQRESISFDICLTGLFFPGDLSTLGRLFISLLEDEPLGIADARLFTDWMPFLSQGAPGHWKSWNLGKPFSRPGKSWKIVKVMESYGKVMENDDNVMEFLLLHW